MSRVIDVVPPMGGASPSRTGSHASKSSSPRRESSTSPSRPSHSHLLSNIRSSSNLVDAFPNTPEDFMTLFDPKDMKALRAMGGLEGIAEKLDVDLDAGLDESGAHPRHVRAQWFGENRLPDAKVKNVFHFMWDAMQDKTLILLTAAAVISLILGLLPWLNTDGTDDGWYEGTAIFIAVVIVVIVTAGNDLQKDRQFRKLNATKSDRPVKVIRGGDHEVVSVYDVIVGDIVVLETGDVVCADGIFVQGYSVQVDESGATGEPDAVKKSLARDPFFLSGTQILDGSGTMLALAVGEHSFHGKMMMSLRTEDEDTPLQARLNMLAEYIGRAGLIIAIITLIALITKLLITVGIGTNKTYTVIDVRLLTEIVTFFITAVTIVVVAVPEGLPLAVTIALAYSMLKMLNDKNLVRHLSACETMGGATNICSDKTGTLTQNRMTVVQGTIAGHEFKCARKEDMAEFASWIESQAQPVVKEVLTEGVACNTTAFYGRSGRGVMEFIGSKTEVALLTFIQKLEGNINIEALRGLHRTVRILPFSSDRKRMSTVVDMTQSASSAVRGDTGQLRVYTKGAPEIVLGFCTRFLNDEGKSVPMNTEKLTEVRRSVDRLASAALRTIAISYCNVTSLPEEESEVPESDMVLLGVVGIEDPVRPEVPNAVAQCQKAGITVRMVTGDNMLTAVNIARQCGIMPAQTADDRGMPTGSVMEGPEFRKLTEFELDHIIPHLRVLARSSPLDKQILVDKLKELGEVVAVTGDGTNDAPALKLAHVGFSMGVGGTEVAKEASDVVLLDDNFASIVKAVMWGRNVYDSIRKFIQFQLTVNVVAVTTAFVGAIQDDVGHSPLTAVQLLWVNLIMDTMAALALATDRPTDALLSRQPHGKREPLISRRMWRTIAVQSVYQLIIVFIVLFAPSIFFPFGVAAQGSVRHYNYVFNVFVFLQLFNEINCRKLENELNAFAGFFSNGIFLGVIFFTIGVQVLLVEFAAEFASTTSLHWTEWLVCIGLGAGSLPVGVLSRLIPIREAVTEAPSPAALTRHETERRMRRYVSEMIPRKLPEGSKWKIAQRVRMEINVVSAFRNPRRLAAQGGISRTSSLLPARPLPHSTSQG